MASARILLNRVMYMWNSGYKLVWYWGLELGLINKGRLLSPVSTLKSREDDV